MSEELIGKYLSEETVKQQTDYFINQMDRVKKSYFETKALLKNLGSLEGGTNITAGIAEATKSVQVFGENSKTAVREHNKLIDVIVKAGNTSGDAAKKIKEQAGAYNDLSQKHKEAQKNAENLAAKYGVESKQAIEAAQAAAKYKEQLNGIANLIKTAGASTSKQELPTNAFAALNQQYKEAQNNARIMAAEFGLDSKEALEAAESVFALKQRLDEIKGFSANYNLQQYAKNVPSTSNFDELQKEQIAAETTAEAVTDLDRAQAAAANSATVWGAAQKGLADNVKGSNGSIGEQEKIFTQVQGSLDQYTGTLRDNLRILLENKLAIDENKKSQKEIESAIKGQGSATETQIGKLAALKEEQELLAATNNRVSETIRLQAKEFTSTSGSIEEIETRLASLSQVYESLGDTERSKPFGKELKKQIDALENSLANVGKGFNPSAFAPAVQILVQRLEQVRQKIAQMKQGDPGFDKLQKEEQLLTQLTANLGKQFETSRTELRAFQDAAIKLGITLGEDSEEFLKFNEAVGDGMNQIEDLKAATKFQAGDARFINGLVSAATGLAGAYSIAQGTQEIFGDSSEELQKKMVRLQAVLTVLNGLQAVSNAIQTESGAIQVVLAGKTAVLTAAKRIQVALYGQGAIAAQAEAVAQVENAAATEAAAVANTTNAGAAVANTAATEAQVVVTEAATVATTKLSMATKILTTLGILGVITGVVLLVAKLGDWLFSTKDIVKEQENLTNQLQQTNEALIEQANLVQGTTSGTRTYLQNQLTNAQAAQKSQIEIFAARKTLYKEEQRLATEQVATLGATNKQQAELATKLEGFVGRKQLLLDRLKKDLALGDEKSAETTQKAIDLIQGQINAIQPLYDAGQKAREDLFNANQNLNQLEIEEQAFSESEKRKLVLETARIWADAVETQNQRILNSDRSTLGERIKAIEAIAAAQRRVTEAEKNDVLNDPSSSPVDKTLAIKKAAQEEKAIQIELADERIKLIETDRIKRLAAQKNVLEDQLELSIEYNKKIAVDENISYGERLKAFQQYTQDQKVQADANYKFQLEQAGLTAKQIEDFQKAPDTFKPDNIKITYDELLAIASNYRKELAKLDIAGLEGFNKVVEVELQKQAGLREKSLRDIKRGLDRLDLGTKIDYNKDLIGLIESYNKGNLSRKEFLEARANLDADFYIKSKQTQIRFLEEELQNYSDAESKELEARAKVNDLKRRLLEETDPTKKEGLSGQLNNANIELKAAQELADKKIQIEQDLADKIQEITENSVNARIEAEQRLYELKAEFARQFIDLSGTITSAIFDSQIEDLENQKQANAEYYNDEIAQINALAITQEEKNKRIIISETQRDAKAAIIDAKENDRKRKKAEFERVIQIAQISFEAIRSAATIRAQVAEASALAAKYAALALTPGGQIYAPAAGAMAAAAGAMAAQIPITFALAAAQIASIIAVPIKYALGTDDHPGGDAIVGDGGRKEVVIEPSGKTYITPNTPTLIKNMPKHTVVKPDAEEFLKDVTKGETDKVLSYSQLMREMQGLNTDELKENLNQNFKGLNQTIKNQPKVVLNGVGKADVLMKYGYNELKHIG